MDAQELRLGNYVTVKLDADNFFFGLNNTPLLIKEIRPDAVWCELNPQERIRFDIADIKPIPLTEELLEECGFNKMLYGTFFLEELYIELQGRTPFMMIGGIGAYDFECQYLHQLQNIWYSLYREELNIELQTIKTQKND